MKKIIRDNYILILILILALAVRVVGLVPGYSQHHPDEGIFSSSAIEMLIHGDFNPRRFDYPAGVSLIYYFIYSQFIVPVVLFKVILASPKLLFDVIGGGGRFFSDYVVLIFGNREINALFWSRHTTAVLGTLSVFVTYLVGAKLFNKKTGLFAAFFLAFNYRHVYSSHFALSDVPNSLFAILSFFVFLSLFKKNSLRNYILSGVLLGISFAVKYQIFPVFTFLFIHFFWVFKQRKLLSIFDKKFFLTFFIMFFLFSLLNIHIFFNIDKAIYWIDLVSRRYGAGFNKFNFYPLYYLFYWGIGPLPSIAIILGMLFSLIFYPLKSILLLSYILPFFFVFLYYMSGGTYVRNFTTVMPFLMIFAGLFFSMLLGFFKKAFNKKSLMPTVIILFLAFVVNLEPIRNSSLLSVSYLRPWNRQILKTWAEEKLPKTAKIANDNLGLEYDDKGFIQQWNVNEENSIAELQEEGYDFAVYNTDWRQSLLHWWFGTNPSELVKYKKLPYEILDNSYNGIALEEFMQNLVFEIYKPWQAPDINYFVVKIPNNQIDLGKEIYYFGFDNGDEGWRTTDIYGNKSIKGLYWDGDLGNTQKGSLVHKGELKISGTRYTSKLIPVRRGKVYTAVGFLKTEDNLLKARQRDGFLRLDFYEDKNLIARSVSGRVYGTTNWIQKQTSAIAPYNANFLTVSFQKDFYGGRVWADDIKIYESDKMPKNYPEVPYIQSTIPKEVLYPNSIL